MTVLALVSSNSSLSLAPSYLASPSPPPPPPPASPSSPATCLLLISLLLPPSSYSPLRAHPISTHPRTGRLHVHGGYFLVQRKAAAAVKQPAICATAARCFTAHIQPHNQFCSHPPPPPLPSPPTLALARPVSPARLQGLFTVDMAYYSDLTWGLVVFVCVPKMFDLTLWRSTRTPLSEFRAHDSVHSDERRCGLIYTIVHA